MSHRREEEEARSELQEQALTQIQHIAHDGALMIEASRKSDGHKPNCGEYIAALEAKVERIANIAEVGEPDELSVPEPIPSTGDNWQRCSADSVHPGMLVDLGDELVREGEPREVVSRQPVGNEIYLEFNDDDPGAKFSYDELVWVRDKALEGDAR